MTDERLDEIRQCVEFEIYGPEGKELLTEVDRLKAENARLQDEKRQAVETCQRAKWDLDTANAQILELSEWRKKTDKNCGTNA